MEDIFYFAIYPKQRKAYKEEVIDAHFDFLMVNDLLTRDRNMSQNEQLRKIEEITSPKNIGNKDLEALKKLLTQDCLPRSPSEPAGIEAHPAWTMRWQEPVLLESLQLDCVQK